jgi:hypothetical protein
MVAARIVLGTLSEDGPVMVAFLKRRKEHTMSNYPLYDIPYLVRDPNEFRMSKKRHEIEVRNQAVVDDYFIARDRGLSAHEARKQVAEKHGIIPKRVQTIIVWFFNEAKKRKKYDFVIKFALEVEH